MPVNAATEIGTDIGLLFRDTLMDIQHAMSPTVIGAVTYPGHQQPVDIELHFRSVSVDSRGLIFHRKSDEATIEIKLATRVMPPAQP